MTVEVHHSPPQLHQPGDGTKRPRGILKNPSFSGPSGPGTGFPSQISPTKSTSPQHVIETSTPHFDADDAKELTHQNTLQNAGPRRSSSAARRASASRRHSSHAIDDDDSNAMRLKWDEANLYLAEQDAGTRMKITEPKTPYQFGDQGAMEEEEEDVAIDPRYVNVDEFEMKQNKSSSRSRETEIPGLELGEPEEDPGVAAHAGEEESRIVRGSMSRDSSGGPKEKHVSVSEGSEEKGGHGEETPGMPTREEAEKHRQFEERRKRHYEMKNMKGVLGNPDAMDEDDVDAPGLRSLPDRGINGVAR